jgi:hypothetical protein
VWPCVINRLGTHVVGQYFRAPLHASRASEDLTRHTRLSSDRRSTKIYPNDLLCCTLKIYYKQVKGGRTSWGRKAQEFRWHRAVHVISHLWPLLALDILHIRSRSARDIQQNTSSHKSHLYAPAQTSQSLAIFIPSSVSRIFTDAVIYDSEDHILLFNHLPHELCPPSRIKR